MFAFCFWFGHCRCFKKPLLIAVLCGMGATVALGDDLASAAPKKVPGPKVPAGVNWKIEIIPGPAIGPSPVPKAQTVGQQGKADAKPASVESTSGVVIAGAESTVPIEITPAAYAEVYNSIPFRRSEYLANPSYRHEATIEVLLGQIRPKTVVNMTAPAATCCTPQATTYWPLANPWMGRNFYYHHFHSRPTSYWMW